MAGAAYPDDGSVQPMRGESIAALLQGEAQRGHSDDYVTALFHRGRAFLRQGDWKITQNDRPFDESGFALYDLRADPGETTDLAAQKPEKLAEMIDLWRQQRRELGIVLPQDL